MKQNYYKENMKDLCDLETLPYDKKNLSQQ